MPFCIYAIASSPFSLLQKEFVMRLATSLLGIKEGNFRPEGLREAFAEKIEKAVKEYFPYPVSALFAPTPAFTNKVSSLNEDDDQWSPFLFRTLRKADGGIVSQPGQAVAFFTGDCPIVCIYCKDPHQLAVLHAGYRCLVRENRQEESIVSNAVRAFNKEKAFALIGYGIKSCCWKPEPDKSVELMSPEKSSCPDILAKCIRHTTKRSPFGSGIYSANLYLLAKLQLMQAGIKEDRIRTLTTCTCCDKGGDGKLLYWSHNRHEALKERNEEDGRNLAIAVLVE